MMNTTFNNTLKKICSFAFLSIVFMACPKNKDNQDDPNDIEQNNSFDETDGGDDSDDTNAKISNTINKKIKDSGINDLKVGEKEIEEITNKLTTIDTQDIIDELSKCIKADKVDTEKGIENFKTISRNIQIEKKEDLQKANTNKEKLSKFIDDLNINTQLSIDILDTNIYKTIFGKASTPTQRNWLSNCINKLNITKLDKVKKIDTFKTLDTILSSKGTKYVETLLDKTIDSNPINDREIELIGKLNIKETVLDKIKTQKDINTLILIRSNKLTNLDTLVEQTDLKNLNDLTLKTFKSLDNLDTGLAKAIVEKKINDSKGNAQKITNQQVKTISEIPQLDQVMVNKIKNNNYLNSIKQLMNLSKKQDDQKKVANLIKKFDIKLLVTNKNKLKYKNETYVKLDSLEEDLAKKILEHKYKNKKNVNEQFYDSEVIKLANVKDPDTLDHIKDYKDLQILKDVDDGKKFELISKNTHLVNILKEGSYRSGKKNRASYLKPLTLPQIKKITDGQWKYSTNKPKYTFTTNNNTITENDFRKFINKLETNLN